MELPNTNFNNLFNDEKNLKNFNLFNNEPISMPSEQFNNQNIYQNYEQFNDKQRMLSNQNNENLQDFNKIYEEKMIKQNYNQNLNQNNNQNNNQHSNQYQNNNIKQRQDPVQLEKQKMKIMKAQYGEFLKNQVKI